jgi:hypothetical protein
MIAKRTAPSFVGRGFNRDATLEHKKGLQPLKYPVKPLETAFCCNLVAAVAAPFFVISTPASRLITHRSSLVTFTHTRTPTL